MSEYKRLVVKFGTNLLTGGSDHLDEIVMTSLVDQVTTLHEQRKEIIVVSSGAVAAGRYKLGLKNMVRDIPLKQVLASVGQGILMNTYENLFGTHKITVAQALLTKADIANRASYLNARNTLIALLELGVICIVNENDVVATEELKEMMFGDNDNLSAMVAHLVEADILIMLSDIGGLFTSDPNLNPDAMLIPRVDKIDKKIMKLAGGSTSGKGVGGMATKIQAAKLATSSGITVVIASGKEPNVLVRIANNEHIGTLFMPATTKVEGRKRWLISGLSSRGWLYIDQGATSALQQGGRSLLPAGIVRIEGHFERGDVVDIFDNKDERLARGITNYSDSDLRRIKGLHSNQIADLLGYHYGEEVVHRNNMVIL